MVKKTSVRGKKKKTFKLLTSWVELRFVIHHQKWCFNYLVNIWIFFGAPVTVEIAILPFVEVGMGSSYGCCLSSSGLFLFSLMVSVSPAFHELYSLCFQDMCIFFTSLLDGNPLSLPFISPASHYGRRILFPLFSPPPLRRAVIYHVPYPDRQVATLTKVRPRGEVCVHLFVYGEIWAPCGCAAFWISVQQADIVKQWAKERRSNSSK